MQILPENFYRVTIVTVQSGQGTEPHKALTVLENAVYPVIRQALCYIKPVKVILFGLGIQPVSGKDYE
jgi:hypothetical protein